MKCIGTLIWWIIVSVTGTGLAVAAEIVVSGMTMLIIGFARQELTAGWRDIPLLVTFALLFSGILTCVLSAGDKFLRDQLDDQPRRLKVFTVVFIFIGSHIGYEVFRIMHRS